MYVFGSYLLVLGALMMTIPDALLSLFGIPPVDDIWIRVVGLLTFNIGILDIAIGWYRTIPVIQVNVLLRCWVFVVFVLFVLLDLAPPILAAFGLADLVGALWTEITLRTERSA